MFDRASSRGFADFSFFFSNLGVERGEKKKNVSELKLETKIAKEPSNLRFLQNEP